MAATSIVIDSSIVIEFFRKGDKTKSMLYQLSFQHQFYASVITAFEVQVGLKSDLQRREYQELMMNVQILELDQRVIDSAVQIHHHLQAHNAHIGLADLLIGATTLHHALPLATLNQRHFKRIPDLTLLDLSSFRTR